MVNERECEAAGVDPVEVARIARRIGRAAKDAERLGLTIFGGAGSGSLRAADQLIVAWIDGGSWDGGDGGNGQMHADGLERGETI